MYWFQQYSLFSLNPDYAIGILLLTQTTANQPLH